jgi:hypothetical protein
VGERFRTHGKSKTTEYVMFYDARKRALKTGLPFDITPEDIVVPECCPIFGTPFVARGGNRMLRPTLDRIIPSRGYVRGNIAVISFRANFLKRDATLDELRKIIRYIEGAE